MTVEELSKEQLEELKQRYYMERHENVSLSELIDINDYVTDEEIKKEYEGICFTDDDFFVSVEERGN